MNPATPCSFVWYELMTTDPEAAAAFYRRVVGWTAADAGMPGMAYTLLTAGPHAVAGLMALPADSAAAGATPAWVGYVGVASVDAAARAVQAAGGRVCHEPADIPGVGRFAVVADPQSAIFCLFTGQDGDALAPPPAGSAGSVGWHELLVTDVDVVWPFYASQFGWTREASIDMGPAGAYQLFAAGGEPIGGMMNRPPGVVSSGWMYYFNVPELDAAVAAAQAGGGRVLMAPMQVPGGSWVANCMDPQGAVFALVAPTRG